MSGGLDEVFARNSRSLLTDALGSTIASADTTTVAAEYTHDPFGGTTLTGDDQTNPTRYTGREDDGNGLYYYRNRYYSPGTRPAIPGDTDYLEGELAPCSWCAVAMEQAAVDLGTNWVYTWVENNVRNYWVRTG